MTVFSVFYQREDHSVPPFCMIQTPQKIFSIPLDRILFIESRQKHSILHLEETYITLSIPLYRILQELPSDRFLQTHRSFLVNLRKISHIDKHKDPWVIFFTDSDKTAFVSRTFRKDVLQTVLRVSSH